jgi:hypothetical protein
MSSSRQSPGHRLYGEYAGQSMPDSFGNISLIHFATFPPCNGNCSFLIENDDRRIEIPHRPGITGMIRLVPVGIYRLTVGIVRYCPRGNDDWDITEGGTFISEWRACAYAESEQWQVIGIASAVTVVIIIVIIIVRKRAARKELDRRREFVMDTGPSHVRRQSGIITITPLLKD